MKAVILAGGLGARLKPITEVIPKPLLPIGEKSVLEIQINRLKRYGFDEIFIATNYMAEYVDAFIGDGSRFGVRIHFSKEKKPLGTCGPLSLIRDALTEPFIMMNGDILTTLDFGEFYAHGCRVDADLTVATTAITTPFRFGNVESTNGFITNVNEKPDLVFEIVAGIYVLKPRLLEMIPDDTYFGVDQLIKAKLARQEKVGRYLMKELWLDVGSLNDYQEAQRIYAEHFHE
jgi:NDP-sugar pyrophosphorylase family protein